MKRPSFLDEKPKIITYFVAIELLVALLGILLAIIALLTDPSLEPQEIGASMNLVLSFLDLFGGISLGTLIGLLQTLLNQDPALFLLVSSVIALLFSGLNLLIAWFLWNLKAHTYSSVLLLATINISLGFLGMPSGSLHLPVGVVGFVVNFVMIREFMAPKIRERFDSKPIQHIRIVVI